MHTYVYAISACPLKYSNYMHRMRTYFWFIVYSIDTIVLQVCAHVCMYEVFCKNFPRFCVCFARFLLSFFNSTAVTCHSNVNDFRQGWQHWRRHCGMPYSHKGFNKIVNCKLLLGGQLQHQASSGSVQSAVSSWKGEWTLSVGRGENVLKQYVSIYRNGCASVCLCVWIAAHMSHSAFVTVS